MCIVLVRSFIPYQWRRMAVNKVAFLSKIGDSDADFQILSKALAFNGYRRIIQKEVQYPDKRISKFDVVSQGCPSVVVFTWDTKSSTTTLIKEFHPGVENVLYGVVAGMFEVNGKHESALDCAQQVSFFTFVVVIEQESTGTRRRSEVEDRAVVSIATKFVNIHSF